MDRSEQIVNEYLRSIGFAHVAYEPDGNVPPDFLVESRIAIEVRRLNQNIVANCGHAEGLEETFIPFFQRFKNYLPTLGPSIGGESWYVCVNLSRPLEPWAYLEPRMGQALAAFKEAPARGAVSVEITPHLELEFLRAGQPYPSFFLLGAGMDEDSGGWVLSEILRNLQLILEEKERKVAPFRHKYKEWWLVLPDHIGYGLDALDREQFRTLPKLEHSWAKIILVNPLSPSHAFEI